MPTRKVAWKGKVKSREGAVGSCWVRLVGETQSWEDPVKYPQKHPSKQRVSCIELHILGSTGVNCVNGGSRGCCCSADKLCPTLCTPWIAACQASLSFTISQSLLKFMSIELVMLYNHLIFCHPLLLLPSIFPSIRVSSYKLTLCIRWPKYWNFSFRISPSNEYSRLISFRIDLFDLFAGQGTLKSSPAPQFKIINSLVLSLLYCSTT